MCTREAKSRVSREEIERAAAVLLQDTSTARVILFGSHARGDARSDSDVDFLVIESTVSDRRKEMVRLRRKLLPLRIPVDVLAASEQEVDEWGKLPGTTLSWALSEGEELLETAP